MRWPPTYGALAMTRPGGLSCGGSDRGLGHRDILLYQLVMCILMTWCYGWWWGCTLRPQGLLSQDTAVLGTGWPPLTGCPAVIWIRKTKYFPQVSCCCAPTLSEYIPSTRSVLYSKSCVTVTVRWHLSQYIGFLSLRGTVSRWALASLYSCALHKTSLLFNLPNTEQGHCSYQNESV